MLAACLALAAFLMVATCLPAQDAQEPAAAPDPPRRYSRTVRETLFWAGAQQILVTEAAGRIKVQGRDRSDIELKGIQTAFHKDLDTAREHVSDVVLSVESRPGTLRLRTRLPETWKPGLAGRIDYSLLAPQAAPLSLETVTGGISVINTKAPLDARTVAGDVFCSDVGGPVTIVSVTGNVRAEHCSRARSIRTVTGSIDLTLETLEDDLEIHSLSGPVTLTLGEDLDATVMLYTGAGAIEYGGADDYSGRRLVEKVYGSGARTIVVRTLTGNIVAEHSHGKEGK